MAVYISERDDSRMESPNHPIVRIKTTVRPKGQVTIKKEILEAAGISVGDILELTVQNGVIVAIPQEIVPKAAAFYYTPEWQEAEHEVEEWMSTKDFINQPIIKGSAKAYIASLRDK